MALALLPAVASAQATRTWVSGVGDDINPCSRSAPCKTFAGAISKTAIGGEINAIDSGGFGAVTITKPITIDGRGVLASVLNAGSNGIVVNTTTDPAAAVVLRNLAIMGASTGAPPTTCPQRNNGTRGINIIKAGSVRVENVTVQQQNLAGIAVATTDTSPSVFLNRVDIQGGCGPGVSVAPGPASTVALTVRDSTISDTDTGITINDRGSSWLTNSTVFNNAFGLKTVGTGKITSYSNNQIHGNGNRRPGDRLRDRAGVAPGGHADRDPACTAAHDGDGRATGSAAHHGDADRAGPPDRRVAVRPCVLHRAKPQGRDRSDGQDPSQAGRVRARNGEAGHVPQQAGQVRTCADAGDDRGAADQGRDKGLPRPGEVGPDPSHEARVPVKTVSRRTPPGPRRAAALRLPRSPTARASPPRPRSGRHVRRG